MSLINERDINQIVQEQPSMSIRNRQKIRDLLLQCEWLYEPLDEEIKLDSQPEEWRYRNFIVRGDRDDWILLISSVAAALAFVLAAPQSVLAIVFGAIGSGAAFFAAISDVVKVLSKDEITVYVDILNYIKNNGQPPTPSDLQDNWEEDDKERLISALNQLMEKMIVQRSADDILQLKA